MWLLASPAATAAFLAPSATPSAAAAADASLRAAHGSAENSILNDLFRPVATELPPTPARLLFGALPADLPRGAVLKNGPNPQPEYTSEQGGWLDGDGMLHCVVLPVEGEAAYSRTWVRTEGFVKEREAKRRLFDGSLVAPRGLPLLWGLLMNGLRAAQPQKDTANTGLLPLGKGGRVLALMEQCLPAELRVETDGTVTTLAAGFDFDGQLKDLARHPFAGGALTAHMKVDAGTGERIGVTYPSAGAPGARITTFAADGSLSSDEMVPLLGTAQSMIHDCAIVRGCDSDGRGGGGGRGMRGYTLLLDLPMTVRPRRMLADRFPVEYEPGAGGRIGLHPRRGPGEADGAGGETIWIEVEPCVVLHTVNAHQSNDGRRVTLTALRSTPSGEASFIESYSSAFLYQWVLDTTSATCVREGLLCNTPLEFPTMDGRLAGLEARFGYAITPCSIGGPNRYGPPNEGILIDGVAKLDLRAGGVRARWQAPDGFYLVSEPTFVPKAGSAPGDGDAGFLLVFVCAAAGSGEAEAAPNRERADGRAARLYVLDAAGDMGAVAALELPGAVPYGLHSAWLPVEDLA